MRSVPDPYRVLGVTREATLDEIKAAHRVLAKRHHPDAAQGDTRRFLAVQEAYQTLADPLKRREWDARHAGGPVRASDPAARSRTRGPGRSTPPGQRPPRPPAAGPKEAWSATDRDPSARTYTWSASGVPWWEEHGSPAARRPPGRRRPTGETTSEATRESASESASESQAPPSREAPRPAHGRNEGRPKSEFDVYSRSSGAAWSQAARSYFRRAHADQWIPGAPPATPADARSDASERPVTPGAPATPGAEPFANGRRAGRAPGPQPPADTELGTSFGRLVREFGGRPGSWPTLGQRLLYATTAWVPLALAIVHVGGTVTGCDRAAASCPVAYETVLSVVLLSSLVALGLAPRLAYLAAMGTLGLTVSALGVAAVYAVLGVRAPLPEPLLILALTVWLAAYALFAWGASQDRPVGRPWRRHPGRL